MWPGLVSSLLPVLVGNTFGPEGESGAEPLGKDRVDMEELEREKLEQINEESGQ